MTNLSLCAAVTAFVVLLGCSRPAAPPSLPAALDGGWVRGETETPREPPELVRKLGLARSHAAVYSGSGKLAVTVYEMTSDSGAFELVQKWKAEPGQIFLHKGRYFVLVQSPGMDTRTLSRLAGQIEAALGR